MIYPPKIERVSETGIAWSSQPAPVETECAGCAALHESNRLVQTALDDQRESLAVAEEERDALREQLRLRPTEDALRASNAILHEWRAHAGEAKANRDRWKARAEAAEFGWAAAECDLKIAREELARSAHECDMAVSMGAAAEVSKDEQLARRNTVQADRDRLAGLIREFEEAAREIGYRRNEWTPRLGKAESELFAAALSDGGGR